MSKEPVYINSICPHCDEPYTTSFDEDLYPEILDDMDPHFCPKCNGDITERLERDMQFAAECWRERYAYTDDNPPSDWEKENFFSEKPSEQ